MGPDPWARALLADGGGGDGGGKRPAGADPAPTTPAQTRPHNFKNVSLVGGRGCPHGIFYPCERWRGRGAGPAGCAPPPPLLSPGLGRPKRVLGSPFFVTPKRLGVYPKSRDKFSGGKMLAARSHVGKVVLFVKTLNLYGKHKNAEGTPTIVYWLKC